MSEEHPPCPKCETPLESEEVDYDDIIYYCGHCDEEYGTDEASGGNTLRKVGA